MTELAYGRGLQEPQAGVRLHDADLLPDIDYAEGLLKLADLAVRHQPREALDSILFALCWARFDLTVTGEAARRTCWVGMDRSDVRYEVEQALHGLLGKDDPRVDDLTERIVRGTLHFPRRSIHEAA